jgi:hypothetical protein
MQFFLAQACRGEALQSEDGSSKEKKLSANICVEPATAKLSRAKTGLAVNRKYKFLLSVSAYPICTHPHPF